MNNWIRVFFIVVCINLVLISFVNGQPLPLSNDDAVKIALPFSFPFGGNSYDSVWVGSNGFLTFGVANIDPGESVSDLLFGPPRIAAMWDDLDPGSGGTVTAQTVGPNFVITYSSVPEYGLINSNTFSIILHPDGSFDLNYGQLGSHDGLVGRSLGKGDGGDPGEIDLSAEPEPIGVGSAAMVYEIFDAFDNDLSGDSLKFAPLPGPTGAPNIVVSPNQLVYTLPQDIVTTDVIKISNGASFGAAALHWTLTEQDSILKSGRGKSAPLNFKQQNFRELPLDNSQEGPFNTDIGISAIRKSSNPSVTTPENGFEYLNDIKESPAVMTAGRSPDVHLILDDGIRDNALGLSGGGQFLWLNRFTPFPGDFPFTLDEIWVLFGSGSGINAGELVDIYVWQDTDGDQDPGTGATLVGSINNAAVQFVDDINFSVYMPSPPITLNGPGDVLIGVVNRTAGTDPAEYPASIDQTFTEGRSWLGLYNGGIPPDPPFLPANGFWGRVDEIGYAGNLMIRGFEGSPQPECPWISASPVIGTASPGASTDVQITINTNGLSDGVYNCNLVIYSTDPNASPLWVPAQITVAGPQKPPDIHVTPASLTFNIPENGLTERTMTISNTAPLYSHNLTWSITEDSILGMKNGKPAMAKIRNTRHFQYRELKRFSENDGRNAGFARDLSIELPFLAENVPQIPVESFPSASAKGRDVSLILDDGSRENAVGFSNGGQFLWFNRFTPDPGDFPFTLNHIWILFGAGLGVNVGESVDIYVYVDTDGDGNPANATFKVATHGVQVQAVDDVTFSKYNITPTVLNGPGDVLIAVVNRTAGIDPNDFPAALDASTSAMRSWIGVYNGPPPDPPTLPAPITWGIIDNLGAPGNWMIRGFEGAPPTDFPWITKSPVSGTLAPGESVVVDISIDATGLGPGTYICNLVIDNNDPNEDPTTVPVTLNAYGNPQKAQPVVCYASTGFEDGGRFLKIDKTTGTGILIGPTGLSGIPGLAINSSGSVFGTEEVSGDLYRIDAATGSAIFVGSTNVPFLDCIAFDENDVLYGIGSDPPNFNLLAIDTLTAATTIIGPTGDLFSGLAYDSSTSTLWGSTGDLGATIVDGIFKIDRTTGASTLVGLTGLGGPTPDLCVDGAGNLFGSKGDGLTNWISIDKTTASGTVIGSIGFTSVSGLASFGSCIPGVLGDVDGDGSVNSTDALVILSYDAEFPLPPFILERINRGFGDVYEDGATNSTDGLITLSFDVGIPVPFPIGDPICL